jgi:hypothetical protein
VTNYFTVTKVESFPFMLLHHHQSAFFKKNKKPPLSFTVADTGFIIIEAAVLETQPQ